MGQFFLIKDQICLNKKETYVIRELDCDSKDDALEIIKDYSIKPSEIIYIAEVVAKRYGDLKSK